MPTDRDDRTAQGTIAAFHDQIHQYFMAAYGADYAYQPPEAFLPFERWLYALATRDAEFGAKVMDEICAARVAVTEEP